MIPTDMAEGPNYVFCQGRRKKLLLLSGETKKLSLLPGKTNKTIRDEELSLLTW